MQTYNVYQTFWILSPRALMWSIDDRVTGTNAQNLQTWISGNNSDRRSHMY